MMSSQYCEVLSHIEPNKSLKDHLENVSKLAKNFIECIPIKEDKPILIEVVRLIGLYHDIGKATPFFQEYIREREVEKKAYLKNQPDTRHSLISAISIYFVVKEFLDDIKYEGILKDFLPLAAFIAVRRHHTDLKSIDEDIRIGEQKDVIKRQVDSIYFDHLKFLPYWDKIYEKLKKIDENWQLNKKRIIELISNWSKNFGDSNKNILPYLLQQLFLSILLDADKHEVAIGQFLKRKEISPEIINNYKKIKFDKSPKEIDKIRNEIYNEVISQLEKIDFHNEKFFSLTAPTGTGKTLTVLNFALKLREIIKKEKFIPRIIYSLPFLSIIDQNAKVVKEVFELSFVENPSSDLLLIHHHLSDYSYKKEDTEYEYDKSEILIEGWDSEIIITTFVQFFHTLFSNKNRVIRKFHKILGGIIILDEIQSFPYKYWLLFKKTAEIIAEYFDTYFILSTATQPAIFNKSIELLPSKEKYFNNLNRTQIILDIEKSKTVLDLANELINEIQVKPKNLLIVLNTIRSAVELFNAIKNPFKKMGYEIYFLSSHIIPKERISRIDNIKKTKNKKVIISTQLVEAGVDIDLDKVIRDFGPMDSINQVTGRANRNMNIEKGEVKIIKLEDENTKRNFYSYIYDPVLIENTKEVISKYKIIQENEFLNIVDKYYQNLPQFNDISNKYIEAIERLQYNKISQFELIEEKFEKIDIFVEVDEEAKEIWKYYNKIFEIKDFKERKEKFLQIRGRFYEHVISISLSSAIKNIPPEFYGLRFISNSQLDDYYDLETGFKLENEHYIW